MDNENKVLCEKIINDIYGVFLKDPDLSSFEIIPTTLNQNKSPVLHVDHHLGLESWCSKHVYNYAHRVIVSMKQANRHLQKDAVVKYVNVALLINPDVTSFWHIRRQLTQRNKLKVHNEFQFSALILSKKPKSSEAFAYRRWLYSFESIESVDWSFEIGLCDRCADKSSSNYHAWSHRQWVIQKAPHLLKTEIMLTEKFMRKHISDYSCYHYRQMVLNHLFDSNFYESEELANGLVHIKEYINSYIANKVHTPDDILAALLPGCDLELLEEERLNSFLFCCNIAAYDIKFCEEQKNMFGPRESFEYHRREMFKFIVENCLDFCNICTFPDRPADELYRYDHTLSELLMALRASEAELGERHRQWCNYFLGFEYPN